MLHPADTPPSPIAELAAPDQQALDEAIAAARPFVLRGHVAHWPAVAASRGTPMQLASYVAGFDSGHPADVMVGAPGMGGRYFYRDDMRGFNFHREQAPIGAILTTLLKLVGHPDPLSIYAGSAASDKHLPGWTDANPLPLKIPPATARVWIGNASHVSTHFDLSPNLACVVAGVRRFLLFPPEQVGNLYVGPLEVTMAGQPVSMVNPDQPDLQAYPRFAEARRHAQEAVLQPGDAIFIPSFWWHNIQASGPLNILVNYWWDRDEPSPIGALAHALLAIRDLPPAERAGWRAWFDHYVFSDDAVHAADHLPDFTRGVMGAAGAERSERIRQFLGNILGFSR